MFFQRMKRFFIASEMTDVEFIFNNGGENETVCFFCVKNNPKTMHVQTCREKFWPKIGPGQICPAEVNFGRKIYNLKKFCMSVGKIFK